MNQLRVLAANQFRVVFRTVTVQIWIAIVAILIAIFAIGMHVEHFPNGVIWSFFSKELPGFENIILNIMTGFVLYLGLVVFFPIGVAGSVHALITPQVVSFYLSRPLSRTKLILGQLLGVFSAYAALVIACVTLLWCLVWIKSGINTPQPFYQAALLIPIACASHVLLVSSIFATRSIGTGTLFYILYVFLLFGLIEKRTAGVLLWERLVNLVLDGLSLILPPIIYMLKLLDKPIAEFALLSPPLISSFLSIIVLSSLSIFLYRRMEF